MQRAIGPSWNFMRNESGTATVEMAIVLLPLLLILFGIMEGGLVIMTKHQMDRASREAARFCSLYTPDLTLEQNMDRCADSADDIIGGTLFGTDWTVSVTFPTFDGAQAVKVSISKPLPLTAHWFPWATTLSASTTVVADWS